MKIKHLEMVQAIIARMNQNSFFIKGWSVTLVVAILAVAINNKMPRMCIIALIPIIVFWGLDSFYMHQERLFRTLHRKIAEDIRNCTNHVLLYDMDTKQFGGEIGHTWNSAHARTVWPVYLVLCVVILLIYFTNS